MAVSPEFQEMFAVSGDGQDINIFPLTAEGNSAPAREIHVPHASGGVSFDIKHDEIYITTGPDHTTENNLENLPAC